MARRYHGRRRQADGRLQDLCQAGTQDHPGICLAHSGGGVAMRDVYILGVGQTKRGWFPERGLGSLVAEAGFKATDDAGIPMTKVEQVWFCLLYTSDAADDLLCVDLGGRRIIKKKKKK